MKRVILILFLLFFCLSSTAHSAQPLDVLKDAINQVLSILEDPVYQDASRKESQQKKIRCIINQIFDFKEMSKRTLARNWKIFTAQQKKEFSDVFGEFLADNYLKKIQTGFKGEKVVFLSQEMVTDTKAMAKTKILRETVEIPVDYSMLMRSGTWKVYDVKIEGVSLMKNYRAQFSSILLKEKPSQLIDRLRKKIEEQG